MSDDRKKKKSTGLVFPDDRFVMKRVPTDVIKKDLKFYEKEVGFLCVYVCCGWVFVEVYAGCICLFGWFQRSCVLGAVMFKRAQSCDRCIECGLILLRTRALSLSLSNSISLSHFLCPRVCRSFLSHRGNEHIAFFWQIKMRENLKKKYLIREGTMRRIRVQISPSPAGGAHTAPRAVPQKTAVKTSSSSKKTPTIQEFCIEKLEELPEDVQESIDRMNVCAWSGCGGWLGLAWLFESESEIEKESV
jgi:hypothetical protein